MAWQLVHLGQCIVSSDWQHVPRGGLSNTLPPESPSVQIEPGTFCMSNLPTDLWPIQSASSSLGPEVLPDLEVARFLCSLAVLNFTASVYDVPQESIRLELLKWVEGCRLCTRYGNGALEATILELFISPTSYTALWTRACWEWRLPQHRDLHQHFFLWPFSSPVVFVLLSTGGKS